MINNNPDLNRLLPLVAIGTIADCQSIVEPTNRKLTKAGLKMFYHLKPVFGLNKLILGSNLQTKFQAQIPFNSQDLAFILSPILNSSGRISHARLSIKVLVEDNQQLTNSLIQTNQHRKQIVKEYVNEIEIEVNKQIKEDSNIIWLVGKWNKGVIGLIASKLVNKHNLPIVVISQNKQTFNQTETQSLSNMIDKIANLKI
jgi:single-stranded-DNA-specific exonuclease